jgi:hypothetical protein|tara:strand:- start:3570 stop:3932 length:363 start_codon:yes stop_codon:yes gene_type:complete
MHLYHAFRTEMAKGFKELRNVKPRPDLTPQTTALETPDKDKKKPQTLLNSKHLAFDKDGNVVNPRDLREKEALETSKRMNVILATGLLFIVFGQIYLGSAINGMTRTITRLAETSLTGAK